MKGPSRCGAVRHAPSSPLSQPGPPSPMTMSTTATTPPASAERAGAAAST